MRAHFIAKTVEGKLSTDFDILYVGLGRRRRDREIPFGGAG
jgi:hypothetical protein